MWHTTLDIAACFSRLGEKLSLVSHALDRNDASDLSTYAEKMLFEAATRAILDNPWFTLANISLALKNISSMLQKGKLYAWLQAYDKDMQQPTRKHTVLLIMAGNIPLVGAHDMLCVLASGHAVLAKMSSHDRHLPGAFARLLCEAVPACEGRIKCISGLAENFDAVIATGSNNSARYFSYYFGKYPHIIRNGRTSAAILYGDETPSELQALAGDVFSFYGLGCRNVSQIWLPAQYDIRQLVHAWGDYSILLKNQKYANNYLYHKAIYIVNRTPHTDTGYGLLTDDSRLFSPVSVVHTQHYHHVDVPTSYFERHKQDIQCIVATRQSNIRDISVVRPGTSQQPELWDYADGIDTMKFLLSL